MFDPKADCPIRPEMTLGELVQLSMRTGVDLGLASPAAEGPQDFESNPGMMFFITTDPERARRAAFFLKTVLHKNRATIIDHTKEEGDE